MCFAPLVLVGYLMTMQPNQWHVSEFSGALLQAQTCDTGLGLAVKASPAGIGSLDVQYGWQFTHDEWALTLSPKAGVGYLDHHVPELTSHVNFSLGAQILIGYGSARMAVEYWHQSNAGLGDHNAGLDMLAISGGWRF